jgi:hypothetical protein
LKKRANLFFRKGIKEIREFMPREQVQQCLETFSVSNLLIIITFVQLGFN